MKTCRGHDILTTYVRTLPLRYRFFDIYLDMCQLRFYVKQFYQGYILSFIDYVSVTWGSASVSHTERLTKLQKRAAWIILRTYFNTPSEQMIKELGWSSVPTRIKHSKAVFTFRALTPHPRIYNTFGATVVTSAFSKSKIIG